MSKETYIKFYNQLPEPYRSKAIENFNPRFAKNYNNPESLKEAIDYGFDWEESVNGSDYWFELLLVQKQANLIHQKPFTTSSYPPNTHP